MNITSWLLLIAVCAALSGVIWWSCAWWYGRKLAELQGKLDRTRKAASTHALQTRQQIAKLQRALDAHEQAREKLMALQTAPGMLESQAQALAASAPALPVHGFADTQPM